MLYKSKTFELLELLDIVGMFYGYCSMSPRGRFYPYLYHCDYIGLLGTGFMQVMYLGRAPRTKETLPDFLKWCRVTRHPLVFRGLTGSQRTPGIGVSQFLSQRLYFVSTSFKYLEQNVAHSCARYPSAIQPSGYTLLRTYDFKVHRYLLYTMCRPTHMLMV